MAGIQEKTVQEKKLEKKRFQAIRMGRAAGRWERG
jgi:hypothetical protein